MDRELGILGWSQAELARKLGVTPAAVTTWRQRGLPRTVQKYLEAMVRAREAGEALVAFTARTPRAKRSADRGQAWERSATDHVPQQPDGGYRDKLERWEEADMDQSDDWGQG